jgi:hypothetical protein
MSSVQRGLSQVPSNKRYVVTAIAKLLDASGAVVASPTLAVDTVLQDMGKTIITVNTTTNVTTILRKVQVLPRNGDGSGRTGYISFGDNGVDADQNISSLN